MACVALAFAFSSNQPARVLKGDEVGCEASDDNHRRIATIDILSSEESAPYRVGADWVVDRTMTLRAKCSYHTLVGNISTQSYTLDPFKSTKRVTLCQGESAVAPYAGPCPPK